MTNLEKNFNDKPISNQEVWANSQIEYSGYVQELVNKIEAVAFSKVDPIGITIALTGPLGSGKSSIVNMAKEKLLANSPCMPILIPQSNEVSPMIIHKEDIDQYIEKLTLLIEQNANYAETKILNKNGFELNISDFSCYWFSGDEKLALSFISHISSKIGLISEEAKKLAIEIGALLVKAIMPGLKEVVDFIKKNITAEQSLNDKIKRLDDILRNSQSKKRFLIVLDDLDRMEPNEILAIFRIIKTFGNLRNLMFLLVYDDAIISDVTSKHFPAAQGKYIEKFIQLRVNVLPVRRANIVQHTKDSVLAVCGLTKDDPMARGLFNEVFFISKACLDEIAYLYADMNKVEEYKEIEQSFNLNYLISNNLRIPRSITIIKNEVSASWETCKHLVCVKDLLVMALLKTYNQDLYQKIYDYCDAFTFDRESFRINIEKIGDIPFVCEWWKNRLPFSFSLTNPTFMSLYFFGADNIDREFKQDFPNLFSYLASNETDCTALNYDAVISSLIHDLYVLTKHFPYMFYHPFDYEIEFDQQIYFDGILLFMLLKPEFKDSLSHLLKVLFSKMASKSFFGFTKALISNDIPEYNLITLIQLIRKWSATLIADNESYNTLFDNNQIIQHLAKVEDKDYLFFLECVLAYHQSNLIFNFGNTHVIYKCYLESLFDAISNDTIFKSYVYSYHFLDVDIIKKLRQFDQNDFTDLGELFSSIKIALQQKFHDKQVDDNFFESLIYVLYDTHPSNLTPNLEKDAEKRLKDKVINFNPSFITFYELNLKDFVDSIEDYHARLNSNPKENKYSIKTTAKVLRVLKKFYKTKSTDYSK